VSVSDRFGSRVVTLGRGERLVAEDSRHEVAGSVSMASAPPTEQDHHQQHGSCYTTGKRTRPSATRGPVVRAAALVRDRADLDALPGLSVRDREREAAEVVATPSIPERPSLR
jgi:hypothetical protein